MGVRVVKYTIALKVKGSQNPNEEYLYSLSLTSPQENNPELVFTPEFRESMRTNLQNQSQCKINDCHLNQIIQAWILDIKEGYRASAIALDLPLAIQSNIAELQETGNQELPGLIPPDLADIAPTWGMLPPLNFC